MADKKNHRTAQWLARIHAPEYLALLGLIVYLAQSVVFAHIRLPNLDEGSYLYKGLSFATGAYKPFQPYGFWMNKMYLSFLIWGWVQEVFAPGLLASRYGAIFLGALALVGLWIVSRRMGNKWLATIAVWIIALNPTLISIYSTARSEVLIICMLTWMLVLSLGAERPSWQIIVGSALAGIMVLTRENMVFVLPLLVIYIFWQHGWLKGILSFSTIFAIVLVGHLIYWPSILYLWERWLPAGILRFLGQTAALGMGSTVSGSPLSLASRLHSLSQAIRIYYIPFIGSVLVLFLWPKRSSWPTRAHFRAAVFLAVLFFSLFISHAWASLGKEYCVYCLKDYMAFWGNVGLLLIIVTIGAWNNSASIFPKIAIITTLLVFTTATGYALFEKIGSGLLNIPVPRLRSLHFLPGWATLWQVLSNKYQVDYWEARAYLPAIAGLVVGIFLLVILFVIYRHLPQRKVIRQVNFFVYAFLILGVLLLPVLTWPYDEPICQNDVIKSFEQVGAELAKVAPPSTKIYLDDSLASIPLLYTKGNIILPPQINDTYSFKIGGNPDTLLRNGFWNEQIGLQWRNTATVFIIGEDRLPQWRDYLTPDKFQLVQLPANLFQCTSKNNLFLFRRK